jgi:hypothetical protein
MSGSDRVEEQKKFPLPESFQGVSIVQDFDRRRLLLSIVSMDCHKRFHDIVDEMRRMAGLRGVKRYSGSSSYRAIARGAHILPAEAEHEAYEIWAKGCRVGSKRSMPTTTTGT